MFMINKMESENLKDLKKSQLWYRFREGLILYFGLLHSSKEEQDCKIQEVEEKWWFCGGCDTRSEFDEKDNEDQGESQSVSEEVLKRWSDLWKHYFPNRPMPQPTEVCVCKQKHLRYNCYITDGNEVIIIGRICMYQFIKKAKDYMKKKCSKCFQTHRNRNNNYCKDCRIIVKKEEEQKKKEEEDKQREEERKQRQKEIDKAFEELTIKMKKEEEERKFKCYCGKKKQPGYDECRDCFIILTTCSCGNRKLKRFEFCSTCYCKKRGIIPTMNK